jgi:CheY-like chemotaxis protein
LSALPTILYIEDNVENLDLVRRVLEATGLYQVLTATDGELGLQMVDERRPNLVLVDLDIPGLNGFEVIRQIKSSSDPDLARTPVAVVTANVLTHERDQAMEAGCAAFIEKPFEIKKLRQRIESLLDSAPAGPGLS